jgi:hypothetical protein
MMVEAVHLRSVITNTGLIERMQQTQQEQQNQNLRHAIHEDLREFANRKEGVNLTTNIEDKIIVNEEAQRQGAKGQEQKKEKKEVEEDILEKDITAKQEEGSIIDILV